MDVADKPENEDMVLSIYPAVCEWARWVFKQSGNDYVHDGLVSLLQRGLPDNRGLLFYAWKYSCIDAARRDLGDPRHPLGKFGGKTILRASLNWDRMPGAMPPEVRVGAIRILRRLLQEMPPRTQAILLAWAEGENLKDIAEREGLSQGRVSQIMKEAAPGFKQFHQAEKPKGNGKPWTEERKQKARDSRQGSTMRKTAWDKRRRQLGIEEKAITV